MRPYIIGLNNPQGLPPLDPTISGSAGRRLYDMVSAVYPMTMQEWCLRTQRQNLLSVETLPVDFRRAATKRAGLLAGMILHRTVVLLGNDVANAFGHTTPSLEWAADRDWIHVPHPSGRNLFYNNPAHRLAVGTLLADIIYACEENTSVAGGVDAA